MKRKRKSLVVEDIGEVERRINEIERRNEIEQLNKQIDDKNITIQNLNIQIQSKDEEIVALQESMRDLKAAYRAVNESLFKEQQIFLTCDYLDEEWPLFIESLSHFFTQGFYAALNGSDFASDTINTFNIGNLIKYSNQVFVEKFANSSRECRLFVQTMQTILRKCKTKCSVDDMASGDDMVYLGLAQIIASVCNYANNDDFTFPLSALTQFCIKVMVGI